MTAEKLENMKHTETDKLADRLHREDAPLVVRYNEMRMHAQRLEARLPLASEGQREAAGTADGKSDGQAENDKILP